MVMDQDQTMSQVYQSVYGQVKANSEHEMDELKSLHEKFDYIYDKERQEDKLATRWYDPS